jgi:hypothetical protein
MAVRAASASSRAACLAAEISSRRACPAASSDDVRLGHGLAELGGHDGDGLRAGLALLEPDQQEVRLSTQALVLALEER